MKDKCTLCCMIEKASVLEVQIGAAVFPAVRIAHLVTVTLRHLFYSV